MKHSQPIAVSGIGCLCALGDCLDECMATLFTGKCRPAAPRRFECRHSENYPVFELPGNMPLPGDARLLRTSRMALAAATEALRDAAWDSRAMKGKKVGVCIGTTVGSAMNNERFHAQYREGRHPDMASIDRYLKSNPAACIARALDLTGPCQTVVNACSSGSDAIGIGASWIRNGLCDLVIAGGADEMSRITYNGFISLMITDEHPCRPFDRHRKGLNLGEGAAICILESENTAAGRSRPPRAFVHAYGTACDAYHITAPSPDGKGLIEALGAAVQASGIGAEQIAFINAHGTGTPDNDRVESRVLDRLFKGVPFFSNKGCTGHTLGAAGAVGAALTIGCLEAGRIPASAGFSENDPELPAVPTNVETAINGCYAISESLAFGGNNAVLVLGKGQRKKATSWAG